MKPHVFATPHVSRAVLAVKSENFVFCFCLRDATEIAH